MLGGMSGQGSIITPSLLPEAFHCNQVFPAFVEGSSLPAHSRVSTGLGNPKKGNPHALEALEPRAQEILPLQLPHPTQGGPGCLGSLGAEKLAGSFSCRWARELLWQKLGTRVGVLGCETDNRSHHVVYLCQASVLCPSL